MSYLDPDIIDDETAVAEASLAGVADRIDGWEPAEGHVESSLAEAVAVAIATAITVLKGEALDAIIGFGLRTLAIARGAATLATAPSTWTFDGTDEVMIPAGTEVVAALPAGGDVSLAVAEDTVKPAGVAVIGGVQLVALEAGPDANGATNPASSPEFIGTDTVTLDTVALDAPASGGADAEDPEDYADRVTDRARRLHTIPITPSDHAAFATDVAWVARALAVNRADPATPGVDAPGHITLIAVDDAGQDGDAAEQAELEDYFDTIERALNLVVHVAGSGRVDITVAATVRGAAGVDPVDLQARAEAAITTALDPADFDVDDTAPGGWKQPPSTRLSAFDIAAVIDDLEGLASVQAVTLNGSDHIDLPAPVTLPNLVDVTVTVE